MVDTYGRWTYDPNTPEEKKCDMDRLADYIRKQNYTPKTDLEHLADMIFLLYDSELEQTKADFTLEGCIEYVELSGGLKEFDYYC